MPRYVHAVIFCLALLLSLGQTVNDVFAQAPPRIAIVADLSNASASAVREALRKELAVLGRIDGQNVTLLEPIAVAGQLASLPALAEGVVRTNPALILAAGTPAVQALKQVTNRIPIVMLAVGDPVAYGLVASLPRPGGNVTGTAALVNDAAVKLLQVMREAAPHVSEVAVVTNSANAGALPYLRALTNAAPSIGVKVHSFSIRSSSEIDDVLATMRDTKVDGLLLAPEPLVRSLQKRFAAFAMENRIAMVVHGGLNEMGPGVLAVGAASGNHYQVIANYIDRILKGAAPAELPVWQPVAFELGLNRKTAAILGVTLPANLLLLADRTVEE